MLKGTQVEAELKSGVFIRAKVIGDGPPLLLLHGVPGSGSVWDEVADRLAPDFQVIVPDLLGFGDSDRGHGPGLLSDPQATAVHQLLTTLRIQRPAVVGHDFGGPVALTMERLFPGTVGKLVLSATNTFPDTPIPFPLSSIFLPVVGSLARKGIFSRPSLAMMIKQGVGNGGPALDPQKYLGDHDQSRAIATIFSHSLMNIRNVYTPVENTLRGLNIPIQVIWGTEDPFFPLAHGERTAEAAGVDLVVYNGAGHFIPEERPAEFARDIASFVAAPERAHRSEVS